MVLLEVIEIPLAAQAAAQPEDVDRRGLRVETHELARALPQESRTGQQVVRLKRITGGHRKGFQRQFDPARLHVVRIEVGNHDQEIVLSVRGQAGLAVANQQIVVDRMKAQVPVLLERGVFLRMRFSRVMNGAKLSGRSRFHWRNWYFSESRYSSLPGSRA